MKTKSPARPIAAVKPAAKGAVFGKKPAAPKKASKGKITVTKVAAPKGLLSL